MASNTVENMTHLAGEKLTTCDVVSASEHVSDYKKNFICSSDILHEQMLSSPWLVLMTACFVLFTLFLVKRAADIPHRASTRASTRAANHSHDADVHKTNSNS